MFGEELKLYTCTEAVHMYNIVFGEELKLYTCTALCSAKNGSCTHVQHCVQQKMEAVHMYSIVFSEELKLYTCRLVIG